MTVRLARPAFHHHPLSTHSKSVHRAVADVRIGRGNHEAFGDGLVPLRGWYPFEILHFPVRSLEHCVRKYVDAVRRAGEERGEGNPEPHGGGPSRVPRRASGGVLRPARRGRRRAPAGPRGRHAGRGHAPARRLASGWGLARTSTSAASTSSSRPSTRASPPHSRSRTSRSLSARASTISTPASASSSEARSRGCEESFGEARPREAAPARLEPPPRARPDQTGGGHSLRARPRRVLAPGARLADGEGPGQLGLPRLLPPAPRLRSAVLGPTGLPDPDHAPRGRAAAGPRRHGAARGRLRRPVRDLRRRLERDGADVRPHPCPRERGAPARLPGLGDALPPGLERRGLRDRDRALGAAPCPHARPAVARGASRRSAPASRRSCSRARRTRCSSRWRSHRSCCPCRGGGGSRGRRRASWPLSGCSASGPCTTASATTTRRSPAAAARGCRSCACSSPTRRSRRRTARLRVGSPISSRPRCSRRTRTRACAYRSTRTSRTARTTRSCA